MFTSLEGCRHRLIPGGLPLPVSLEGLPAVRSVSQFFQHSSKPKDKLLYLRRQTVSSCEAVFTTFKQAQRQTALVEDICTHHLLAARWHPNLAASRNHHELQQTTPATIMPKDLIAQTSPVIDLYKNTTPDTNSKTISVCV